MSSTAYRNIARLPLEVFDGLQHNRRASSYNDKLNTNHNDDGVVEEERVNVSAAVWTPMELRREIAGRLKALRRQQRVVQQQQQHPPVAAVADQNYNPNTNSTTFSAASSGAQPTPVVAVTPTAITEQQQAAGGVTTVGALLKLSTTALMRALDPLLTYNECQELIHRICLHCAPKSCTALDLLEKHHRSSSSSMRGCCSYIPTALPALDAHLRGGLRVGTLSEVVGCAATAKSQLAMQVAVTLAQQWQCGTVLVDTENKISLPRMREIALERQPQQQQQQQQQDTHHVLENISVHSPRNMQEFTMVLQSLEEEIVTRNNNVNNNMSGRIGFPVRLIVIDSIAAPARREFYSSASDQAAKVVQIAQILKRLADQFDLAVLIINQVGSSVMTTTGSSNNASSSSATAPATTTTTTTKAALGTAWHHCVSTRIQLEQPPLMMPSSSNSNQQQQRRLATVVKSNLVGPSGPIEFQVVNRGLVEL